MRGQYEVLVRRFCPYRCSAQHCFVVTKGDLIAKLGENPAKGQTFRVFSLPAATPLLYGVTVIQGWRPHCQCGIYLVLTAH